MTDNQLGPEQFDIGSAATPQGATAEPQRSGKPLGFDVGSCHIVACRQADGGFSTQGQLNAFFELPYRKFTEDLLEHNRISYFQDDGTLIIIGDEAGKFALVMDAELHRPMRDGLLNPTESKAQWVVRKISEMLVSRPEKLGETLCLSVPAVAPEQEARLLHHQAVLQDMFMSLGYRVRLVNEGHATVLAALADNQFNGIGISLGAGMCNGCLSYFSVPVLTFSYGKGGDFIDRSASEVTEMSVSEVRIIKETELDLGRGPANRVEHALQIFHDHLIRGVLQRLQQAIEGTTNLPKIHQPLPLVLGGGTVMPAGFLDRFRKIFKEFRFALPISEVVLTEDPLTATARGACLAAAAEEATGIA